MGIRESLRKLNILAQHLFKSCEEFRSFVLTQNERVRTVSLIYLVQYLLHRDFPTMPIKRDLAKISTDVINYLRNCEEEGQFEIEDVAITLAKIMILDGHRLR